MKKFLSIIILSTLLMTGAPKTANAIVLDPAQIAGKISDYVQKISDAIQSGIEEINKIKQMAIQGFNFDALLNKLADYGLSFVMSNIQTQRFNEIEQTTYAQNKRVLELDRDAYKEAATALYDKQIKIVDENYNATYNELLEERSNLVAERQAASNAKAAYESETDETAKLKKLDEYQKHAAKVTELEANVSELEEKLVTLDKQKAKLTKERDDVPEDAQYKLLDARANAIEEEEKGFVGIEVGELEWDKVEMENFAVGEEVYKNFVQQYFYDPTSLDDADGEEGSASKIAHQSRLDKIMRQRRYLIVNSASHLMQVAATSRRELPIHYKKNKEILGTLEDGNELAAGNAYAATRVENAKALLLYAKLLCAKLQYETARDLLKADVERVDDGNYTTFDLEKYILTEEDVKTLIGKFIYDEEKIGTSKGQIQDKYFGNQGTDYFDIESFKVE